MNKLFELFLVAHRAMEKYKPFCIGWYPSFEQLAVMSQTDDDFEYWWYLHDHYELLYNQAAQGRFIYLLGVTSGDTYKVESGLGDTKVSGNIDGKKFSVHVHQDEIIISRNTQCKSKIMEIWETVTSN